MATGYVCRVQRKERVRTVEGPNDDALSTAVVASKPKECSVSVQLYVLGLGDFIIVKEMKKKMPFRKKRKGGQVHASFYGSQQS